MLQAGLLPLLALRGSAGERILDGDPRSALALPLEGGETGFHGTAVSPDGSTAYVAFSTPDIVLVVDLRAGRLRSAIDLTPAGVMLGSAQAVLSADGKLLFVANSGIGNIAVIDTATERVVKVLPFCPGLGDSIKASPAGKVYIGLQDGRLVTVSCDDLSYKTMSFGVFLDSIALSAQRANLLYAVSLQNDQNLFHAFNLDTGREERRAVLPKEACRPSGGVKRLHSASSGDVAYLGWHESDSGSITADVIPLGGPASQLGIDNLRHAASYKNVGVVPGCVMVIRDKGALPGEIGPPFLTLLRLDSFGRLATELADTKVLFDGVSAPLLHAYAAQVVFVVPYSVAGKRTVKMQLIYKGEETYPIEFNVADAWPGIFTMDSTGQGQAAMLNEGFTLNGSANPAAKGSIVMFYASGGGQTDPPGVDGEITRNVLARPRLPVRVWIQDREARGLVCRRSPGDRVWSDAGKHQVAHRRSFRQPGVSDHEGGHLGAKPGRCDDGGQIEPGECVFRVKNNVANVAD